MLIVPRGGDKQMQFGKCREYPFLIPVVTLNLESWTTVTVTGATRPLRAGWTREMADDIAASQSIDAVAELTAILSQELVGSMGAGSIYAPYISMQLEPIIIDADEFNPTRLISSRYAVRMLDDRFYGTHIVSNPEATLRFPRLKKLRFWSEDDQFTPVQFPIVRRMFANLLPTETVTVHIPDNDAMVARRMAMWARFFQESRIIH